MSQPLMVMNSGTNLRLLGNQNQAIIWYHVDVNQDRTNGHVASASLSSLASRPVISIVPLNVIASLPQLPFPVANVTECFVPLQLELSTSGPQGINSFNERAARCSDGGRSVTKQSIARHRMHR